MRALGIELDQETKVTRLGVKNPWKGRNDISDHWKTHCGPRRRVGMRIDGSAVSSTKTARVATLSGCNPLKVVDELNAGKPGLY